MYQTLKTQLNKFDEEFHGKGSVHWDSVKSFLRSTTIALIEKEVERLEGMFIDKPSDREDHDYYNYNRGINDQVVYLQEQLKLIQEDNG